MSKEIKSIADLTSDPKNARVHTERNISMLEKSLEQYGAARSIVIDENGQIIAGHGVVDAAGNVGIEKVIPIEASGNEIIAVIRRGLTPQQKAELAIADNRVSELAEWSGATLSELQQSGQVDLSKFFTTDELAKLLETQASKNALGNLTIKAPPEMIWILVGVNVNDFGKVRSQIEALEKAGEITVKTIREGEPQ